MPISPSYYAPKPEVTDVLVQQHWESTTLTTPGIGNAGVDEQIVLLVQKPLLTLCLSGELANEKQP